MHSKIYIYFFLEKLKLEISCELSAKQTILLKFQALFSLKRLKNILQYVIGYNFVWYVL